MFQSGLLSISKLRQLLYNRRWRRSSWLLRRAYEEVEGRGDVRRVWSTFQVVIIRRTALRGVEFGGCRETPSSQVFSSSILQNIRVGVTANIERPQGVDASFTHSEGGVVSTRWGRHCRAAPSAKYLQASSICEPSSSVVFVKTYR